MQAVLVVSVLLQLLATAWSVLQLAKLRDWRLGVMTAMLAGMVLLRIMLLQTPRGPNLTAEVVGDMLSLTITFLSLLAVYFVGSWFQDKERALQSMRVQERELRQERDLSDSIINSMPGVFYFYDESGRFLRWNRNFEAVTGFSAAEVARSHPLDFFSEDVRSLVSAGIQGVFATGTSMVEADLLTNSGAKIPYYFTGVRVDHLGQPCLLGVGIDISARKLVEAERDRIVTLTPDMLCVTRMDGFFDRLSPAWQRITGWSEAELRSQPWLDFVHPDDRAATEQATAEVVGGEIVMGLENRFRCRDGSYRWFSWSGQLLPEGDSIIAVARDMTDRKRAEGALRESEEQLRLALDAAQMGIFDWDIERNSITWSRWHEELWGFAPGCVLRFGQLRQSRQEIASNAGVVMRRPVAP